jgi:hypothetical protein
MFMLRRVRPGETIVIPLEASTRIWDRIDYKGGPLAGRPVRVGLDLSANICSYARSHINPGALR